jgi:hypothetical protein
MGLCLFPRLPSVPSPKVVGGAGLLTAQEVDEAIANGRTDTGRWGYCPLMVAAWGCKPPE